MDNLLFRLFRFVERHWSVFGEYVLEQMHAGFDMGKEHALEISVQANAASYRGGYQDGQDAANETSEAAETPAASWLSGYYTGYAHGWRKREGGPDA